MSLGREEAAIFKICDLFVVHAQQTLQYLSVVFAQCRSVVLVWWKVIAAAERKARNRDVAGKRIRDCADGTALDEMWVFDSLLDG